MIWQLLLPCVGILAGICAGSILGNRRAQRDRKARDVEWLLLGENHYVGSKPQFDMNSLFATQQKAMQQMQQMQQQQHRQAMQAYQGTYYPQAQQDAINQQRSQALQALQSELLRSDGVIKYDPKLKL